jgi:hypothetical protein
VHRYAPSKRARDTILADPIYRHGSALIKVDYLAVETVQSLEAEELGSPRGGTPPTRHALDFFSAARLWSGSSSATLPRLVARAGAAVARWREFLASEMEY